MATRPPSPSTASAAQTPRQARPDCWRHNARWAIPRRWQPWQCSWLRKARQGKGAGKAGGCAQSPPMHWDWGGCDAVRSASGPKIWPVGSWGGGIPNVPGGLLANRKLTFVQEQPGSGPTPGRGVRTGLRACPPWRGCPPTPTSRAQNHYVTPQVAPFPGPAPTHFFPLPPPPSRGITPGHSESLAPSPHCRPRLL